MDATNLSFLFAFVFVFWVPGSREKKALLFCVCLFPFKNIKYECLFE